MADEKLITLIANQHTYIFSVARSQVYDSEKCLDLAQEVIFRGIKNVHQFRDEPVQYKVRNWLSRILANCIIDSGRRNKTKPVDVEVKAYHLILYNPLDHHFEKEDC